MPLPRYAAKQDENAAHLVQHARDMGCYVRYLGTPVDLLVFTGRQWRLVEIKDPMKEGDKDEFTKAQRAFMAEIAPYGADFWIWRTVSDVQRDIAAERPEVGR